MLFVKENAVYDEELPDSFDGFKIVQFSDIHYGKTISEHSLDIIIQKINDLKPDVVLFTGDLFDESIQLKEEDYTLLKEKLSHIEAKLKKYAVIGNADYVNKNMYLEIMHGASFQVLENQNDLLYFEGNAPIQFIGTNSILEQENDILGAIKLEEDITNSYFQIWISHEPAILNDIIDSDLRPNILFAGHHLGGLAKIPFTGYLLKQDGVGPYTGDYYKEKKVKMYVSNGVGTYKYGVRFLNPPSISLYRLYKNK